MKLKDQYHLKLPIFLSLYNLWGLAIPFTHCNKFRQLAPLGIPPIELGKLFDAMHSRGELERYKIEVTCSSGLLLGTCIVSHAIGFKFKSIIVHIKSDLCWAPHGKSNYNKSWLILGRVEM
jgi:hypothetical protein